MAAGKGAAGMGDTTFSSYQDEIANAAKVAAEQAGRKAGNLEDQLRVANELLRGLEILGKDTESEALRKSLVEILDAFSESILQRVLRSQMRPGVNKRSIRWSRS
jgi:hypothetical protein